MAYLELWNIIIIIVALCSHCCRILDVDSLFVKKVGRLYKVSMYFWDAAINKHKLLNQMCDYAIK